jgi:hypothetical protein
MGVDLCVLDFLLKLPDRRFGETLCLGRQGIHITENMRLMARQLVAEWNPTATLEKLIGNTGYAETLFKQLGSTDVGSFPRPQPMEDPRTAGRRIEFMTRMPAYLCASARKVRGSATARVQQSDYARVWAHHAERNATRKL